MDALDTVMTALHNLQGIHSPSLLPEDQQPFLEAKEILRLWLAGATAPAVDAVPAGEGLDWAAIGHDYARSALKGEWPGVQSPHYALSGAFTAMAKEIEQLRAALSHGEGRK